MKKISLSKETLRVLTSQEVEAVAGGDVPGGGGTSINVTCNPVTLNTCARTVCGGCTTETAPNATCVPQTRIGPRCQAEPYSLGHGCDPNF